jgi:hypothetical protein
MQRGPVLLFGKIILEPWIIPPQGFSFGAATPGTNFISKPAAAG